MNFGVYLVEFLLAAALIIIVLSNEVDVDKELRGKPHVGDAVRLVGAADGLSGRLEVLEHGAWGTVCNTTFDYKAASVVCRQLGLTGGLDIHDVSVFGRGGEAVTVSGLTCVGSEPSLSDCELRLMIEERNVERRSMRACASHLRDVGVVCQNDSDVVKGVRLSGRNKVSGRLEVFYRGRWGTVCDKGFTYSATRVACRQLGLRSAIRPILFGLEVPRGLDLDIALSDLRCSGNERFLQDCPSSSDPLRAFCRKDRSVGLVCESDKETIFFRVMSLHGDAVPSDVTKSFLVNGEDVFHFEMSGGSGQVLLVATNGSGSDIFLKIILRKFRNTASVLGRSWTAVEHSLWFCQVNESTCVRNSSTLESVLGYRKWTNYTASVSASVGTVLRVESGQPGREVTVLSAPIPAWLGDSYSVYLGHGQESEVIYRVWRSPEVNRCYLRDDDDSEEDEEASRLRRCGDAFVDSTLCRRCGCCYDTSLVPPCYLPVVSSGIIDEGPCLRSLSEILGRLVITTEKPVCVGEKTTLAIGVQTFHDSFTLSVDEGNGNVSENLQLDRTTDLPGWITSRHAEELGDGLQYWAFLDVAYGRSGRYSVRASVVAPVIERYVSPAHVAIVEDGRPDGYLCDDGPTYYLNDDIDLFFLVENYGSDLSISFEVQDPMGRITHSLVLGTLSTPVSTWALKKLPKFITDHLSDFKSTAFQIPSAAIGRYVVKAIANGTCSAETFPMTIEVLSRPRLREVVGELRLLTDESYDASTTTYVVLVLDRLSRSPKLDVRFGDAEFVSIPIPLLLRARLPDFAVSTLPQGSVSWIVLEHKFSIPGSYKIEVIYSDAKWDSLENRLNLSVHVTVRCDKVRFTFEGGSSAKENATMYRRGQSIRLVGSLAHECWNEAAVSEWRIQKVLDDADKEWRVDVVDSRIKSSALVLFVPTFTLEYGFYVFLLRVRIHQQDFVNLTRVIWVRIEPAPLVAEITQGISQVVEWLSNVTIDVSRSTRDPDEQGQAAFANLSFTWQCLQNSKKLSDPITEDDSCFVDSSVSQTLPGPTIQFNSTRLRLLHFPSMYTFHLLVNGSHSRHAKARHVLMVAAKVASKSPQISTTTAPPKESADVQYHLDVEPVVDLRCARNCLEAEYSEGELELVAECQNCVPGEALGYEWGLMTLEGENLKGVDWDVVSTGGNASSNVVLFTSGIESEAERLIVTVTVRRELGESGEASFPIKVTPMKGLRLGASTSGAISLKCYDYSFHRTPIALFSAALFSLEILLLAGCLSGVGIRVIP